MATHPRTETNDQAPPATVSPDEARSAVKLHVMRYVLATSLVAVVAGMILAWLYFAQ
ncbi:hypothetical protein [Reyranella sp. CPCC 100927]|uniref:hypothetical protein n=1 Tax=Reyranella sp. CPCC 100927 TaxID=2599616 RepID=UPI0015B4142A|nr:hypothetical protein [Reyranella sp. CPCC 100927]